MNVLRILWKKRAVILVLTLVFTCLGMGYTILAQVNKVSMTLSISYQGIEKGLNPDGTRFNVFEIASSEVLDRTLSKMNVPGLTVDGLRDRISIYALSPYNINEKIKEAKLEGGDYTYMPNEFSISYSQQNKFAPNHTRELLSALSESYKEVFMEKYTDKNLVLEDITIDKENYEYVEYESLYKNKIESMIEFLTKKNGENSTYQSKETQQTFGNLIYMLQNVMNVDLENLQSFIVKSKISKDPEGIVAQLGYDIDMLTLDYRRESYESTFVKETIDQYDSTVTDFVFIPTLDQSNNFYMNRTKTGLDYLADRSYDAGIEAEATRLAITEKQELIDAFSGELPQGEERGRLVAQVEALVAEIDNKLAYISDLAVRTTAEYNEYTTKDYLKFSIPEFSIKDIINLANAKQCAVYVLIGFLGSCLLVLLIKGVRKYHGA